MDVETLKSWSQFGHPILMWVLLAITLYAGYLGLQVRRTRTADKETRKELVPKQFHIKHYQLGSILLALVVLGTIGGYLYQQWQTFCRPSPIDRIEHDWYNSNLRFPGSFDAKSFRCRSLCSYCSECQSRGSIWLAGIDGN